MLAAGAKAHIEPLSVNLEIRREKLHSSSLGRRSRGIGHIGLELLPAADTGLSASWGMDIVDGMPRLTAAGRVKSEIDADGRRSISLLVTNTYRLPSMTELYYSTPSNIGDPNLQPEYARQAMLTFDAENLSISLFRRKSENVIDWIRYASADPWQATNIGSVTVGGGGITWSTGGVRGRLRLFGEAMDGESATADYQSKYALRYVEMRLGIKSTVDLGAGWSLNCSLEARRRRGWEEAVLLADAFFSWGESGFALHIGGTNLFDETYEDVPGAVAPGRWLTAGVSRSW